MGFRSHQFARYCVSMPPAVVDPPTIFLKRRPSRTAASSTPSSARAVPFRMSRTPTRHRAGSTPANATLDGKQWCHGPVSKAAENGRVALLLTGQSFRARNFYKRTKLDCTNASLPVQRMIVGNHFKQIIKPMEALGLKVDVYLVIVPCSLELRKSHLQDVPQPHLNNRETLVELYGASRVKGVAELDRTSEMYGRIADSLLFLGNAMSQQGVYEYIVVTRHDVALDRPFTDLIPKDADKHRGLTFFSSAHDFLFSFPGEMWNCMSKFWDSCMRRTKNMGVKDPTEWEWRRGIGCFDIGPVHLREWSQGFAFDLPLRQIAQVAPWQGGKARMPLDRTGTSGFTQDGSQHRCHSKVFYPPTESWEDSFMPYIYHVG